MKLKMDFDFKERSNMRKTIIMILIGLIAFTAASVAEARLNVVATDFPCYDFARQVCGDQADVTLLIHPGVEVHAYEPSPADILAISGADLFVYIGGEGDAWAENILDGFDGDAPETLRMMDAVQPIEEEGEHDHGHDHEHDHDHDAPEYDEHIWTSPKNAEAMVAAMADAIAALDPENAATYEANAQAYIEQIAGIDAEIEAIVNGASRRILVFADRFPFLYFVRAYGLDYVAAFPSCTAETEPTPQTILSLIQAVQANGVPVVYTIEMSTQAVARTVAEETGASILTLHSIQTVTQDEFDAGETYVTLMEKNVVALREGLL